MSERPITIIDLRDRGNDVLEITGTDGRTADVRVGTEDDGTTPIVEAQTVVFTAFGWVSALTHHYDPSSLDKDGHRKTNAKSRAMTDEERTAYAVAALIAQNDDLRPQSISLMGSGGDR